MLRFIGTLIIIAIIVLGAWWLWENVPQTHAIYDWVMEKVGGRGAQPPGPPAKGASSLGSLLY